MTSFDHTILELSDLIAKKELGIEDLIKEAFANIEKHNSQVNALITIADKEKTLHEARVKSDLVGKAQAVGSLWGIPFVLKDSYLTVGLRTTAGSKILKDYSPPYNATVVQKLLDAGAILVGKANMDAWGHGATNENSDFGPVCNPYDLTRVAGGSGGGPAAAGACGMSSFGIGEDTGGSIRNPAAWCNQTALKVTYGRVSRYGCIAYASSFDTVGPTAKTAEDCALVLEAIAGNDPRDATSSPEKVPHYSKFLDQSLNGKKIAWPKNLFTNALDSEIAGAIGLAADKFTELGADLVEVTMPHLEFGISLYYVIAPSETSSNLARYDGIRFGSSRENFGPEAKRRIMIGTYSLSSGYYDAYYRKALQARTLLVEEYRRVLKDCDAILMPVTPYPPTKIGEVLDDPIKNMLTDVYTVTQNPAGVPSLALPCGFTKSGLPMGMQLVGNMFAEEAILNMGYQYQLATDWHKQKPNL